MGGRVREGWKDDPSAAPADVDRRTPVISVIIVVEVCLYRDGLHRALSHAEGLDVVGSTSDFGEADEAIRTLKPDVVLFDPATDPDFSLVASIGEVSPRSRLVALGVREEEDAVLRCAEAGVTAYVPRDASIAELIAVIEGAAKGELRCSPAIAGSLFRRVGRLSDGGEDATASLTRRESEVLQLLEEGLSNKQIARRLVIGVSTVKNHVHNLRTKLNAPHTPGTAARSWRSSRRRGVRPEAKPTQAPDPRER